MNALLLDVLACPRCRGPLRLGGDTLRCACGGAFPVIRGIPRLGDGAGGRDPKVAAELETQQHARALYVDRRSVVNHWEAHALPRLAADLDDDDGPVLDLGCGVGHLGRTWAAAGRRAPMVGMDLVVELLGEVTDGYAGLVEGDAHRLPVREGAFGAVVIADALHHMSDPGAVLHEVRRVLRPGGMVVAYEPRELAPIERVKRLVRRGNQAFGAHHRAFRDHEYRRLLAAAGLEIARFGAVDAVGPLVAAGLDLLRAGRLGLAEPVARSLVRVDAAIARADRAGRFGTMLLAHARKSSMPG